MAEGGGDVINLLSSDEEVVIRKAPAAHTQIPEDHGE